MKWFKKAADQGDASAQASLGVLYDLGQGVPQNYQKAVKWHRKAAEQGNVDAQINLGDAYAKGLGVPKNNVLAYVMYSLAATDGAKETIHKRDAIQEKMTPVEIANGQGLAIQWKPGAPLPTNY